MSVTVRFKALADGSKSLYLDIYQHGTRKYEFLDIKIHKNDPHKKEKIKIAEQIRSSREVEIYELGFGFTPSNKKNTDFFVYAENFIKTYTGKDIRLVTYALTKFKLMIGSSQLPFYSVTSKICSDYARYLTNPQNGLSGETPYNYFMKFRRILKEAVIEGIIRESPATNIIVRRKTNQLKKNVLSTIEINRLAKTECSHPEVKRTFIFACYTGLGAAELRKLRCRDVQDGRISLLRQKSKEQVINELHPVAKAILGNVENKSPDEKLFVLPSDTTVLKHLKKWTNDAGIKKNISFYCARHTFATQLLLNGVNLKTVADCLGHSTTNHTLKYLNHVDELKSDAIRNLPGIESW